MNRKWLVLVGFSIVMCAGIQGAVAIAKWKMDDLTGQVEAAAAEATASGLSAERCVEQALVRAEGCGIDVACTTQQAVFTQYCVAGSTDRSWCEQVPSALDMQATERFHDAVCDGNVGCVGVLTHAQLGCLG